MKNIIYILSTLCCAISVQAKAQESISLGVDKCIELAIAQSEDIKMATNASQRAAYDKQIAFDNYLPNLEGVATGTYISPDLELGTTTVELQGMYLAGLSITQPIYMGGKVRTANELASYGQDAAAEKERLTRAETIADAANKYWSYVAVLDKVDMLKAYKTQLDTLQHQMEVALDAGMVTNNEYLQVSAKLSEIKYQMLKVKNGVNLCRLALCYVTGLEPDTQITPADSSITLALQQSLSTDISALPELQLMNIKLKAQEAQIRLAKANMRPQLAVVAGYTEYGNITVNGVAEYQGQSVAYQEDINDGLFSAVAALKVPIFHFGSARKEVKKAQLDFEDAQLEQQKNVRLLTLQATQAKNNLTESSAMISSAQLALQQAEESLRVQKSKYDAQLSGLGDLLDAQAQWQQSKSNLIEAQTQYKIYEIDYLKSTGKLAN